MRKVCWICIVLCLALGGCAGETVSPGQQALDGFAQMHGATMGAAVVTHGEGLASEFALAVEWNPEGETTVEVTAPAEMAGVRATIAREDMTVTYEDVCLNAGTLSQAGISPVSCCTLLLQAVQTGWLLSESTGQWQGEDCVVLSLDVTTEPAYVAKIWVGETDGLPKGGEIFVNDQLILEVAFTNFEICDIMEQNQLEQNQG